MARTRNPKESSFFKAHVLPVIFIFLIPGFSAWFFGFAERSTDRVILVEVESNVQANGLLSKPEKARTLDFYRTVPVSRIMASSSPEAAPLQATFEPVRTQYAIFRWMKRISWICLGTIALTFVIVGLSVACSLRSQAAQYYSLRIGWPVLRTSAAIQVLGQAVLAVALSYWVTAIFMNSYYVKLVAIIGFLALGAVAALWKAIFAKVQDKYEVAGEIVAESEAPRLWQRVREMAGNLETAAPDRMIVGIVPNFFVTEHPVTLAGQIYEGRTLYLSLPMLKILAVDEADAVLGHELAHFSGQDTLWSRKISPLTGKFVLYQHALAHGLSKAVALFMLFFWKLYGLSIRRLSRAREFRADQVGAESASREAMKRALVKITCYCEYRAETENAILGEQRVDSGLNLLQKLEEGYPSFLSSFVQSGKAINERVPHPFDTHPTLHNRLAQLGFEAAGALRDGEIQRPAANSWYQEIATASALEERMWTERQEALQAYHGEALAWRLLPKDEEELAIVLQHFPHAVFREKKGGEATLDFDRIQLPAWEVPILFKDIIAAQVEDAWPRKQLILTYEMDGESKMFTAKFYPTLFVGEKADLLVMFSHYYGRHRTALAKNQQVPD